jgi:phosphoserine phosphatase
MGGTILFQDALQMRLKLIEPSASDIENCMRDHPLTFTPKVEELIKKLHSRGTYVYLVSGGFRQVL